MRNALQRGFSLLAALGLVLGATQASPALGAEENESEEAPVLEIGATNDWTVRGGSTTNAGLSLGFEVTAIQNWLEMELGADVLGTSGHTEAAGDLIFKIPFRLSATSEFMVGAGPKFSKVYGGPDHGTYSGAEVDLDFMFWPHKDIGWYVQPDWSLVSRTGEQSVGLTVGVLIRTR